MRLFSWNEKKIIEQLVVGATNTLEYLPINVFDDIFDRMDVGFSGKSMDLIFPYNANLSCKDLLPIYNEVLERALLIGYLENEGLVYFVPMRISVNELTDLGNVNKTNNRVTMRIDERIGKILLKCMNDPMYVSETLRDYVNNGFKSLEEQMFEEAKEQTELACIQSKEALEQTKHSRWTVGIALITLMISIFQNCSRNNNETNFDSNSTEVVVPLNAMLNYMQNNLDGKLDATMNNTAEIKAKLCDSIVIKNPCDCKKPSTPKVKSKVKPMDNCLKYIRIDTCQDTVISKQQVGKLLPK